MAPASSLSEIGDGLVDLHGQHVHQSLLHQAAQHDALDRFAGADLDQLAQARRKLSRPSRRVWPISVATLGCSHAPSVFSASSSTSSPRQRSPLSTRRSSSPPRSRCSLRSGRSEPAIGEARDTLVGSDASQAHSCLGFLLWGWGAVGRTRYGSEPNARVLCRQKRGTSRGSPGSFSDDEAVASG